MNSTCSISSIRSDKIICHLMQYKVNNNLHQIPEQYMWCMTGNSITLHVYCATPIASSGGHGALCSKIPSSNDLVLRICHNFYSTLFLGSLFFFFFLFSLEIELSNCAPSSTEHPCNLDARVARN